VDTGFRLRVEIAETALQDKIVVESDDLERLRADHGDNCYGLAVLALLWVSLLADTPVDRLNKPDVVYTRFFRSFISDPIGIIKKFSSLYDLLTRSVTRGPGGVSIDFFIDDMRDTPVFFEYVRYVKTGDPEVFKYLSTFLVFGKKYYYEDPTFDETAFRSWVEVEDRLEGLTFTSRYLDDLREIIAWMLRDLDTSEFLPKHGGGAVAERASRFISIKNELVSQGLVDVDIDMFYFVDTLSEYLVTVLTGASDMANERISRLKFVPKDIGKSRSICMEPALYQWLQQGVRLWIEDALRSTMAKYIPLQDQSVNRDLAREGSLFGLFDTIDLKMASDSVHIDLIRSIMTRELLYYLELTRTDKTLAYDDIVELNKYAPMGSALCFPIQSIVYSAVVIHSALSWHFGQSAGAYLNLDRSMMHRYFQDAFGSGKVRRFSVFGDDIICDSRITCRVIEMLKDLGFVVNEEKSFVGESAFRESCGGFYLGGEDVTPLKAKLGPIAKSIHVATLASVVDLANRAYDYGYLNLRRTLIRLALYYNVQGVKSYNRNGVVKNAILFSNDKDASFAIYTPNPRNNHLPKRLFIKGSRSRTSNNLLQRDEVQSLNLVPADHADRVIDDDWYWHIVWWRSRVESSDDSVTAPDKIPRNSRPGWRWTSCPG
jgi:hypothetical protein